MSRTTRTARRSTEHDKRGLRPHSKFPATGSNQNTADSKTAPVALAARHLRKSYCKNKIDIPVLRGIDLEVRKGELLAIIGQSGSGKSTLLHLLGTLDKPDNGEIHFDGNRIDNLSARARDVLRNRHFGMIFQFYHLLPELSAIENVLMPLMISNGVAKYWLNRRAYRERARQLLEKVGLEHRMTHKPREMSGGEMQRAAIARSLIANPRVLLADEPTGNLDQKTGRDILEILQSLNAEQKLTIVMVTHDETIAARADRTVKLKDGRVTSA